MAQPLTRDQGVDILANMRIIEKATEKYMEPTKAPIAVACLNNILDILRPQLSILDEPKDES